MPKQTATKPAPVDSTRWPNVIRGCAYGDSWGDPNEFKTIAQLTNPKEFGRWGPPMPADLRITDDTQMSLALARALDGANERTWQGIKGRILDEWVQWYHDPDNNRAPGTRCMGACYALARGEEWIDATDHRNDGCGTVMRNHAAAFLPDDVWQIVAAWQAITTHGGENSVAACLVEAAVIRKAALGEVKPGRLTLAAMDIIESALGDPDGATNPDPLRLNRVGKFLAWAPAINSDDPADQLAYLRKGLTVLLKRLEYVWDKLPRLQADPWSTDPCALGGEGWRAHECFATALAAADSFPNNPVLALRRATVTNGDSDSIAAVAGALLGAVHENPWPAEWFSRLEPRYQQWITEADHYKFS